MRAATTVFAITIGFLLAPVLSSESVSDEPKRGGTLTLGIRKNLATLNPLVATRSTDKHVRELMFEPLVTLDAKGDMQPFLAESWDISSDGKTYTFHLRKGVKFHNGKEMTARDVKFAIDYSMNPKNGAYGHSRLEAVSQVEVPDRYTLKIHLKRASAVFLSQLTDIASFSAIPEGSLEEGLFKPKSFPPGTGPFKFVEWRPGQRGVFDRFDEYWGRKAYVDRLVIRPIRNSSVRFTALRAGDVDLIERSPYEWVKQVMDGKIEGAKVVPATYAGYRRIWFNVVDAPFNNKTLRRAVAHALRKDQILKAAYFGFGQPGDQKYPAGHTWYFDGVPAPAYDVEKAKALVKESGYGGETIELMVNQGEAVEAEAAVLQANLREVGVNIKLDVLEWGSYTSRTRSGAFEFKLSGGSFYSDPSMTYGPDLTCGNPQKRGSNQANYCNDEVEALLTKAEVEFDPQRRKALYRKILTIVSEDVPFVTIGYTPRFFTVRDYVKGFNTDYEGHFRAWQAGLNYTWLDK